MDQDINQTTGLEATSHDLTAHRHSLKALTGIRFFAAYFVVVFHSRLGQLLLDHHLNAAGHLIQNGFLAVPLFFVLSGFILSYTYEGQIERPGDHRRFWEARFSRIWPVYAVSLLLTTIPSLQPPPFTSALATLFMVQAWNPFNPGLAGSWNFVCWTLSVEALFYLVFPWVQVWLEGRSTRLQLAWIGFMLALCVAINTGSRSLGYNALGIYRFIPLPVVHLPEFFTGVGLGNYFLRARAERKSRGLKSMVPGGGLWTYCSAVLSIGLLTLPPNRWTSLVVVGFALLVYGLAAESTALSRFLSTKLMILGGGISFSIYLMQMPVKSWVNLTLDHFHQDSTNLRLFLNFFILTLISLVLFKAVEDPARKLLRSVFARFEERRSAAAARRNARTQKIA